MTCPNCKSDRVTVVLIGRHTWCTHCGCEYPVEVVSPPPDPARVAAILWRTVENIQFDRGGFVAACVALEARDVEWLAALGAWEVAARFIGSTLDLRAAGFAAADVEKNARKEARP